METKIQQNNNTTSNPYLVTTAVNPSMISRNKVENDLDQLNKAEEQSNYKANIAKGVKNPQMYRAMSALRLNNPFKGI